MLDRPHPFATDEMSEYAVLYSLGLLASAEVEEYERHLPECPSCRVELQNYAEVIAKLALAAGRELPPGARERFLSHAQPGSSARPAKAILLDSHGVLIARSNAMEWQPGAIQGIWIKPLFSDPERQYGTTLVRMDRGVHYPAHRHADVEEVFMLKGDLTVEGRILGQGDYCHAEPHSTHHPSFTQNGCLFILISSQLDEVLF